MSVPVLGFGALGIKEAIALKVLCLKVRKQLDATDQQFESWKTINITMSERLPVSKWIAKVMEMAGQLVLVLMILKVFRTMILLSDSTNLKKWWVNKP